MTEQVSHFDFSALPVVDNHLHPYVIRHGGGRYTPLDSFLGLPGEDEATLAHRDAMLYQRWATRQLAAFLGCEATPQAVAAARAAVGDERAWAERLFRDANVEALVVTRGADGSTIYAGGQVLDIPAVKPAEVLDPTGCGDAYRAGLLYGIAQGFDWPACGRLASLLGSIKIAHRGGQNHRFSRDEIAERYREAFGSAPW